MNDVFILNIDEEEQEVFEPIAQTLESCHISTYCDTEIINNNGSFADIIMTELKNCLVLALVITENCFEKLLSIFDINSKIIKKDNKALLPILHNVDINKAKEKYPFLLECDYITYNENMEEVVSQIKTTVEGLKESVYYNKQLKEIAVNLKSYNNEKTDYLCERINNILKLELSSNIIKEIYNIIEYIVYDIAKKDNIYLTNSISLKNIKKSGVIDSNIEDSINYILELNKKYSIRSYFYVTTMLQNDIDNAIDKLSLVLNWYLGAYYKMPLIKYKEIVTAYSEEISESDLQDIYNIETLVFSESTVGEKDATRLSFEKNPYSLVGARDKNTGEIVAFINAYPITDKFYKEILTGNFNDTNITKSDVASYSSSGYYKLYVSSLCIHPKYNRTSAFGVVYKAFMGTLVKLAKEKGIFISDIIADCATKKGIEICKKIGMEKYTDTLHGTEVYKVKLTNNNLSEIKLLGKQGSELLNLYREKFKV